LIFIRNFIAEDDPSLNYKHLHRQQKKEPALPSEWDSQRESFL